MLSKYCKILDYKYTANVMAVLSTAFGRVTFPTVIWLYTVLLMTVHSH